MDESLCWVLFIGSFIYVLALPTALNGVSLISNLWFPDHQRATATGLISVSMAAGSVVGLTISGIMAAGLDKDDKEACFSVLRQITLLQNCIISVICVLLFLFFKERPKHPPSSVAFVKQSKKRLGWPMYKKLLSNKTYIGNAVIFTLLWGTYTAIGNLLSVIFGAWYSPS